MLTWMAGKLFVIIGFLWPRSYRFHIRLLGKLLAGSGTCWIRQGHFLTVLSDACWKGQAACLLRSSNVHAYIIICYYSRLCKIPQLGSFLDCFLVCWDIDSCNWMLDQHSLEKFTRACPTRPRRIRLAVHFACCVTSTWSRCIVVPLLRFLQRRRNSCPSSQSPPMLVSMNVSSQILNRFSREYRKLGNIMEYWFLASQKGKLMISTS